MRYIGWNKTYVHVLFYCTFEGRQMIYDAISRPNYKAINYESKFRNTDLSYLCYAYSIN